jgi:hypothetical protein
LTFHGRLGTIELINRFAMGIPVIALKLFVLCIGAQIQINIKKWKRAFCPSLGSERNTRPE